MWASHDVSFLLGRHSVGHSTHILAVWCSRLKIYTLKIYTKISTGWEYGYGAEGASASPEVPEKFHRSLAEGHAAGPVEWSCNLGRVWRCCAVHPGLAPGAKSG
jgi:hypothetical protein